jgi:hypothetical protein
MLSLAHFRLQRRSLRSLIYLFWIYSFVSRAVGVFLQIYIYELFNSVQLAIIAGIVTFTGIMIGFCICGVVAALYRLNAKHGFLLSFLFTGLGLILLPLARNVPEACGAVAIRGIGSGLFWLTIQSLWKQAIMNATSIRHFCPPATRSLHWRVPLLRHSCSGFRIICALAISRSCSW